MSSLRLEHFKEKKNDEELRLCLNTINEVHDMTLSQTVAKKHAIARNCNIKIKKRSYQVRDLVQQKGKFATTKRRDNKLGANWKGLYKVIKVLAPGTYQLKDLNKKILLHS